LIILIMFGEKYKLWSSSLCSFLQTAITTSLFISVLQAMPASIIQRLLPSRSFPILYSPVILQFNWRCHWI
jgi:hypothetical protein